MKHSYWMSVLSGEIYEMPADWTPAFDGWMPVHEETYRKFVEERGF